VGGRLECEVARTGDISGSVGDAPMVLKVQINNSLVSHGPSLFCSIESSSLGKLVIRSDPNRLTRAMSAPGIRVDMYQKWASKVLSDDRGMTKEGIVADANGETRCESRARGDSPEDEPLFLGRNGENFGIGKSLLILT